MWDKLKQAWKGSKLEKIWNWSWERRFTLAPWILTPIIVAVGFLIVWFWTWPEFAVKYKNNVDRITLTVGVIGATFLGTVGLLNLFSNYRRTNTLEKQLRDQRENINDQRESSKRRDDQYLYATNVRHLGNNSESVRIGGIYGLERLAKESKNSDNPWGPRVAKIFCARVRITTTGEEYSEKNEGKPSNEIDAILKVLTQGEDNPFVPAQFDLTKANLEGADLTQVNLKGADLSEANLTEADLSEADLRGAKLNETILNKSNLRVSDLTGADLTDADLTGAKLSEANLKGATVNKAKLSGAILYGVDLKNATLKKAVLKRSILREADLEGVDFEDADLEGADLKGANLSEINLPGANLSAVNLTGVNLAGVNLRGAILNEVDLSRAKLREADLSGTNLLGAKLLNSDLSEADLSESNLKGACLSRANLSNANLKRTYLKEANLSDADLSEANLYEITVDKTELAGADLRGAFLFANGKNKPKLSKCKFTANVSKALTNLKDIYWGTLTPGLEQAIKKDQGTGKYIYQKRYLTGNNVSKRKPTPKDKEYLVGRGNVDKCTWGDIWVLK